MAAPAYDLQLRNVCCGWKADIENDGVSDYGGHMASDQGIAWSATLHVRPLPGRSGGLEGDPAGAYAIVLALARDEAHYREMVAAEMESLGLFVAEVVSAAPYEPEADDTEEVRRCAARLSLEWPVQYHNFHTYPHDEA